MLNLFRFLTAVSDVLEDVIANYVDMQLDLWEMWGLVFFTGSVFSFFKFW